MNEIKFTVPGDAIGKGRPRFRRLGKYVQTYTPKSTAEYEKKVRKCFNQAKPKNFKPFTDTVEVTICQYRKFPSSLSKKKKSELAGHASIIKPDIDNIAKSILDPLNGVAYEDDSQVYKITAEKFYSDEPKVEVTIREFRKIIKPIRFEDNILDD